MSAPLPPRDAASILRGRARALARRHQAGVDGPVLEILEFDLAGERYAMETRHVRGVHPLQDLTPLPCTPDFVRGVVNLRGEIVAVLDLKRFFGLADRGLTDLHRLILVGEGDLEFGLLADSSTGVRALSVADIQPAPAAREAMEAGYLQGVTADGLAVLDMAAIWRDPRLTVDHTEASPD